MYSERDLAEINRRIRNNYLALIPVLLALLAALIAGLRLGVKGLVMAAGPLLGVAAVYGILAHIWPNTRYRSFLTDMENGLSRQMEGTVVEISVKEELQDGARVLPVRLYLEEAQDERIVYLNASKRELFPGVGARVRLTCFGRHIREAEEA